MAKQADDERWRDKRFPSSPAASGKDQIFVCFCRGAEFSQVEAHARRTASPLVIFFLLVSPRRVGISEETETIDDSRSNRRCVADKQKVRTHLPLVQQQKNKKKRRDVSCIPMPAALSEEEEGRTTTTQKKK